MAFLHCHECDWEQDDFWTEHYNPEIVLWREIKENVLPRTVRSYPVDGIGDGEVHSWRLLWRSIRRYFRVRRDMVWPTYAAWMYGGPAPSGMYPGGERSGPPGCPKCGHSLCID